MKLIEKINQILTVRVNGVAYNYLEEWDFTINEGLYADAMNRDERKAIDDLIDVLIKIKKELPNPDASSHSQIEKVGEEEYCPSCDSVHEVSEQNHKGEVRKLNGVGIDCSAYNEGMCEEINSKLTEGFCIGCRCYDGSIEQLKPNRSDDVTLNKEGLT